MIARLRAGRAGGANDGAYTGASPVPGTRSLGASRRYRTACPQAGDLSRSELFSAGGGTGQKPSKRVIRNRFAEPTVVDVDFPTVALSEARWDADRQTLFVTPSPMNDRATTAPTTFRVINLPDPSRWTADLETGDRLESAVREAALEVHTTAAPRRHLIRRA
jgi:hypothetical protein